jgi:hypothetical protein
LTSVESDNVEHLPILRQNLIIMLKEPNIMSTIKPAQLNTPGLSSLAGRQSTPSPATCPHKRPGSTQVGVGETTSTSQMVKVIELLIELLAKLFGGKNEVSTTQKVPGTPASPGSPGATESQSAKGGSFLEKLGETILSLFSGSLGKLFS